MLHLMFSDDFDANAYRVYCRIGQVNDRPIASAYSYLSLLIDSIHNNGHTIKLSVKVPLVL